jgi:hypothetical protein
MANGDIIKGTLTSVKVGPTATAVTTTKIEKYAHKSERSSEEVGPFFGDDNVTETLGGKKGETEIEGVVPEGGDAGQDDMIEAYENNTTLRVELNTSGGKVITYTAGRFKKTEITTDAKGTQRFKATVSGVYTLTQDT